MIRSGRLSRVDGDGHLSDYIELAFKFAVADPDVG